MGNVGIKQSILKPYRIQDFIESIHFEVVLIQNSVFTNASLCAFVCVKVVQYNFQY